MNGLLNACNTTVVVNLHELMKNSNDDIFEGKSLNLTVIDSLLATISLFYPVS